MFICGNDDGAKADGHRASSTSSAGRPPTWARVEAARAIEPLCMLWCIPGFLRNEWTHAFALLH